MNLDKSSGASILPPFPRDIEGPLTPFGPLWRETVRRNVPEEIHQTAYWTLRLLMGVDDRPDLLRRVPGFRFLAVGLLDPETEFDAFGVVLFASPGPVSEVVVPEPLLVDGFAFPVVVRRPTVFLHAPAIVPSSGSASCFARSRMSTNPVGPGVLTAKHVTSGAIGATVPLNNNTSGTVLDIGPDGIDAAIVDTGEQPVGIPVSTPQLVAPWTDVEFVSQSSRLVQTKVTLVTDVRGIWSSGLLPARLFLDQAGHSGDSGSLVEVAGGKDEAAGIYLGMYTDPARRSEGIAQHLYQAKVTMDLEVLK